MAVTASAPRLAGLDALNVARGAYAPLARPWQDRRGIVLLVAALPLFLLFAWSVAKIAGILPPGLPIVAEPAQALLLDLGLLGLFALHFHFVQRQAARRRSQAPVLLPRMAALASAVSLVAAVLMLWQSLPVTVWELHGTGIPALLWTSYGMGWVLLMRCARRPAFLLAGVLLVEWCAPTMTFGHLVFALAFSVFAFVYRQPLARLAGERRVGVPAPVAGQ